MTIEAPFSTCPVIGSQYYNCVIDLTCLFESFQDSAYFVVRVVQKGSVHFLHARVDPFLIFRKRVPRRYRIGSWGKVGVLRNDSHFLLSKKSLLTYLIPSRVELAFV